MLALAAARQPAPLLAWRGAAGRTDVGTHKLSWKSVAASAAGAGASTALGETGWMDSINPFGKGTDAAKIFSGTAAGMVNGGVQSGIFDTKPNWGSIAAQSFGSALGDSFTQQRVGTDAKVGKANVDDRSLTPEAQDFHDALVGMMNNPVDIDHSQDIRFAAGPGFRVEMSGVGWKKDFQLDDGTVVLKSGMDADDLRRMIADLPLDGSLPDVPGYSLHTTEEFERRGVRDAYYMPTSGGAQTYPVRDASIEVRDLPPLQDFQALNDQRVATGTYDRFSEIGSAWSAGRYDDIWRHMTFDASDAAKAAVMARSYQPPTRAAQRLDQMLSSPIGTVASLGVRAFGGSQTWQDAALVGGSFGEGVIGGAFGLPRTAGLTQAPPASPLRGLPGEAYRAYLNQRFGRTGDLNLDINARGASDIQYEVDRLAREGHAPGRHGPRVTETALDNRVLFKFDPITGTTTDYYSRGAHSVGRNATQILSNPAMLRAEAYVRGTSEFAAAQAEAIRNGLTGFPVKGIPLGKALGPQYLDQVFGKARLGSANNPAGTAPIDFTDGTLTTVFRKGDGSYWNLHTMYPEPKP